MIQIAIDGPAGAGKSTVAKQVAVRLSINYLDTGAMYRAMAVAVQRQGIDIAEHEKVKRALEHIDISVRYTDKGQRVLANGEDLTDFYPHTRGDKRFLGYRGHPCGAHKACGHSAPGGGTV